MVSSKRGKTVLFSTESEYRFIHGATVQTTYGLLDREQGTISCCIFLVAQVNRCILPVHIVLIPKAHELDFRISHG